MISAKDNTQYDQLMQEIHALTVQHSILRKLIHECTNAEFLEFFMENRMERFRQGQSAVAYFDECMREFEIINMYGQISQKIA